jgi:undecaprenyl-diphosphatase
MRELPLRHALALGLLHGPTELLPISSSGHTTLVPWLAGRRYGELDGESRKSFEVALHAGTAAALLIDPPTERLDCHVSFLGAALLPPALAGYALGERIERRLGTPGTIALGLLAGSGAMIVGEIRASGARAPASLGVAAGLALGIAQALALIPGVSRSGVTLAVARGWGFSRAESDRLSWNVGLPVIAGAAMLKGT